MTTQYIGPKEYGGSPEYGGDLKHGHYRMQSIKPFPERLTPTIKNRIRAELEPYNMEIVNIDKTPKGMVRIWFNNINKLWV